MKSLLALFIVLCCLTAFATVRAFPVSFFIPAAESGIKLGNLYLDYNRAQLDFNRRIRLRASGARLRTAAFNRVFFFDQLDLELSNTGLLSGKLLVRKLVAHGLDLTIEHSGDRLSVAGFGVALDEEAPDEPVPDLVESLLAMESDEHPFSQALDELRHIELVDSSLTYRHAALEPELRIRAANAVLTHDRRGQTFTASFQILGSDYLTSASLVAKHERGAGEIDAALSLSATNANLLSHLIPSIPPDTAKTACTLSALAELQRRNAVEKAPLVLECRGGELRFPRALNGPLQIESISAQGELSLSGGGALRIGGFEMRDAANNVLEAAGIFTNLVEAPHMTLALLVRESAIDNVVPYFPYKKEPLLCEWLDKKLARAKVKNASLYLAGPVADFPFYKPDPETAFLSEFTYSGLEVRYLDDILPASNLSGSFTMDRGEIIVTADSGEVGDQKIASAQAKFYDALTPKLPVEMELTGKVSGDLQKLWESIQPAVAPQDKSIIRGDHHTNLSLILPMRRGIGLGDAVVQSKTAVGSFAFESAPAGLQFTADQTELTIAGKDIELKAEGLINGAPSKIRIVDRLDSFAQQTAFESSGLVPHSLHERLWSSSAFEIAGDTAYLLSAERKPSGDVRFIGRFNFSENFLSAPDLNWQKETGYPATGEVSGRYDPIQRMLHFDRLNLTGELLDIRATGQVPLEQPAEAYFFISPLKIGETTGELTMRGRAITLTAAKLDLRAYLTNLLESDPVPEPRKETGGRYELDLTARQALAPGGTLQNLDSTIAFENGRIFQGDIRFALDVAQSTQIGILPEGDVIQLIIRSQDAGRTLEALGIKENLREGSLEAKLSFPRSTGIGLISGEGLAKLRDLRLTQGPITFRILSFLSLEKLLTVGRGFQFREITIPMRFERGTVIFDRAGAESRGLTFALSGTYDSRSGELDISGTTVVMNELGTILNQIPFVGDEMGAITDAITGAAWTVQGPAKDPVVSIRSATL